MTWSLLGVFITQKLVMSGKQLYHVMGNLSRYMNISGFGFYWAKGLDWSSESIFMSCKLLNAQAILTNRRFLLWVTQHTAITCWMYMYLFVYNILTETISFALYQYYWYCIKKENSDTITYFWWKWVCTYALLKMLGNLSIILMHCSMSSAVYMQHVLSDC